MAKELGDIITGERAVRYAIGRYFSPGTDISSLGKELAFVVYNGFTQDDMIKEVLLSKGIEPARDKHENIQILEDILVEKQKIKGAAELNLFDRKENVLYVNNSIDELREFRHKLTIEALEQAVKIKGLNVKLEEINYCQNHLMNQRYESLARDFVNGIVGKLKERFTNFKDVMRNIMISPVYIPVESWYLPGIFDDIIQDSRFSKVFAERAEDIKIGLYKGIAEERHYNTGMEKLIPVFDSSPLVQKQVKAMALKSLSKENPEIKHLMKKGLQHIIRVNDDYLNYQIIPVDEQHILNLGYVYGGQARNILHYILTSFDPGETVRFIYTGKAGNVNPKAKVQDLIFGSYVISEDYLSAPTIKVKRGRRDFENLFLKDWKHDITDSLGLNAFDGGVMGVRAAVSENQEDMRRGYEYLKCDGVEMELFSILGSIIHDGQHRDLNVRKGNILWTSDILNNSVNRDLSHKNIGRQGAYQAVDMAREAFRKEFA